MVILVLPLVCHAFLFLKFTWERSFLIGAQRYFLLADDNMISMRYALNLARANGLVWNPGDYVQGITNLGWTLVMASFHLFHLPSGHQLSLSAVRQSDPEFVDHSAGRKLPVEARQCGGGSTVSLADKSQLFSFEGGS
jgi:hypothetical protein